MDFFTIDQLRAAVPGARESTLPEHFPHILTTMIRFEIDTPLRIAMFIAQTGHETGNFSRFTENLMYSAAALRVTFKKYFPTSAKAEEFARKPEKIADLVYANRMGNGPVESGDGWRYRGRGAIQVTGRDKYRRYGEKLKADFLGNPDQVAGVELGWLVAGLFWDEQDLNRWADAGDVTRVTVLINGGKNGLDDRRVRYSRAKIAMGI